MVQSANLTGTINDLQSFTLGPLTADLSRTFLQALAAGEGIDLPTPVIDRILERIDWQVPYHLQLLFQEILHRVKDHKEPLDPALVDEACNALLAPDNKIYFGHWDERLNDAFPNLPERNLCKAILAAAAKDRKGIREDTILQIRRKTAPDVNVHAVLAGLEHDGYLVLHEGRWRFTSSLLREWWSKWQKRS